MSTSRTASLTVGLVVLALAILTAWLVTRPPASAPAESSCPSKNDGPATATPVLRQTTFLQETKDIDLSEVVPLYPSGPLLVAEVDSFNNAKIAPRLQSIVTMDYFRFVKLNLSKKCRLWPDDGRCAERSVCGKRKEKRE